MFYPERADSKGCPPVTSASIDHAIAASAGDLFAVQPSQSQAQMPQRLGPTQQVSPLQIEIVRIFGVEIVFAIIRYVVVVHVGPIDVVVRLDIEHQEGLHIVGKGVVVAVGIGQAIVVFVFAEEYAVGVVFAGENVSEYHAQPHVRKAVVVVVVLH